MFQSLGGFLQRKHPHSPRLRLVYYYNNTTVYTLNHLDIATSKASTCRNAVLRNTHVSHRRRKEGKNKIKPPIKYNPGSQQRSTSPRQRGAQSSIKSSGSQRPTSSKTYIGQQADIDYVNRRPHGSQSQTLRDRKTDVKRDAQWSKCQLGPFTKIVVKPLSNHLRSNNSRD